MKYPPFDISCLQGYVIVPAREAHQDPTIAVVVLLATRLSFSAEPLSYEQHQVLFAN